MRNKVKLILILLFLFSCKKSINITTPTIIIETTSPTSYNQVVFRVEEYAEIDGDRIIPEYYYWTIEDINGNIIKNDFKDSLKITWTPLVTGNYIVKVKLGYDQNENITSLKQIIINESIESIKQKLIGHWKGVGTNRWHGDWGVDLYIDNTGHYSGTGDFYGFNPLCEKCVFNTGNIRYYSNWVGDSCGTPYNLPCQRIDITNIKENKGEGTVWIAFITFNNGALVSEDCVDVWDIEKIEFSSNGKNLYFEFNPEGSMYEDWERKFNLTRQ